MTLYNTIRNAGYSGENTAFSDRIIDRVDDVSFSNVLSHEMRLSHSVLADAICLILPAINDLSSSISGPRSTLSPVTDGPSSAITAHTLRSTLLEAAAHSLIALDPVKEKAIDRYKAASWNRCSPRWVASTSHNHRPASTSHTATGNCRNNSPSLVVAAAPLLFRSPPGFREQPAAARSASPLWRAANSLPWPARWPMCSERQ